MIKVFVERSTLKEYIDSGRFAVDGVVAPVRVDKILNGYYEESDLQIEEVAGSEYHRHLMQRLFDDKFALGKPIFIRPEDNFKVVFVPFDEDTLRSKILYNALRYASSEPLEKIVVLITPNWLPGKDPRASERIIQMGVETVSDFRDCDMEVCLLCCSEDIGMVLLANRLELRWGTK